MSLLAFIFLILISPYQSVASSKQAYAITLINQPPETLIPVVQPLLQKDEAVTGFGNELIITTSPDRISMIRDVINKIDTPLRNLMISVKNNDLTNQADSGQSVSGQIQTGNVVIQAGEKTSQPSDLTIQADGIKIKSHRHTRKISTRSDQNIRAVEGQPSFIYTGKSVHLPNTDTRGNPYTLKADALQGVYVTPYISGTQVRLKISTTNDQLQVAGQDRILIDTQKLSTTVTGGLDQWINLGGIRLSGKSTERSTVKKITTANSSIGNISVKVSLAR